jgi:hypothetical protein
MNVSLCITRSPLLDRMLRYRIPLVSEIDLA